MLVDKADLGFGKRSWRYSMLVKDGVIQKIFIEPEKAGDPFEVSDADTMLAYLNPKARKPDQVAILTREGCSYCAKAKTLLERAWPRLRRDPARPQGPHQGDRRHRRRADRAAGVHQRHADRRLGRARALGEKSRLTALERGLALLVEGTHAFPSILGVHEAVVGFDLEAVAGEEVHLQPVMDGLLRLAHRDRRVRRDLLRGLERIRRASCPARTPC